MGELERCCMSISSLNLSPFLLFKVRFETDVFRVDLFPQFTALTARTKWVLITLRVNQMMACICGYQRYYVCILLCGCVRLQIQRWSTLPEMKRNLTMAGPTWIGGKTILYSECNLKLPIKVI